MLKDLIGALILLLIAFGYYALIGDINQSGLDDALGAAGLPIVYATALAALAMALAAKALITWRFIRTEPGSTIGSLRDDAHQLTRAAGMLAIGMAYLAGVTFIGYFLSLVTVIGLVALYQGERAGFRLAGIAIGGAIAFWIFFDQLLGIEMPPGFWPALWGA